jgi:hypothetical protein
MITTLASFLAAATILFQAGSLEEGAEAPKTIAEKRTTVANRRLPTKPNRVRIVPPF